VDLARRSTDDVVRSATFTLTVEDVTATGLDLRLNGHTATGAAFHSQEGRLVPSTSSSATCGMTRGVSVSSGSTWWGSATDGVVAGPLPPTSIEAASIVGGPWASRWSS
jgi:hypothetical protein